MTLPLRRHLGRLLGYRNGKPVYGIDCCTGQSGSGSGLPVGGKRLGRLLGYRNGKPIYAASCCLPTDSGGGLVGARVAGRLVGYRNGKPVYAFARPCCNESASGSGSGCGGPLPTTLYATVPAESGCPCLDGTVVVLGYSGDNTWTGSNLVCDSENFRVTLHTIACHCEEATLDISFDNHDSIIAAPIDPNCINDPVNMVFSNMNFPIPGSECTGPIQVIITE